MSSEIDICNLALSHLGDDAAVVSIDPPEGSAQAENCARFYPMARDMLLESHAWAHATRTENLTPAANTSADWQFAHVLPNDCLRPLRLTPSSMMDRESRFEFDTETDASGNLILLSNVEDAKLKFIYRATNTDKFPPLAVMAISYLLASMLAGPIIKGDAGAQMSRAMYASYLEARSRAVLSDANKSETEFNHAPSWIEARSSWTPASQQGGNPLTYYPSGFKIS